MAMLRAASDRISDILQERRRRVDAGEDPCLKRSTCLPFSPVDGGSPDFANSLQRRLAVDVQRNSYFCLVLSNRLYISFC